MCGLASRFVMRLILLLILWLLWGRLLLIRCRMVMFVVGLRRIGSVRRRRFLVRLILSWRRIIRVLIMSWVRFGGRMLSFGISLLCLFMVVLLVFGLIRGLGLCLVLCLFLSRVLSELLMRCVGL